MSALLQAGSKGGLRSESAGAILLGILTSHRVFRVNPHLCLDLLTSVYSKSFPVFSCSRTKCKSLSTQAVFYRRLAQQAAVVEREPPLPFVENSKSPLYHL